ncbi:hypothetical protein QA802_07670 [Streptomyces sp. B21-105]|uniref:hypothetical protein n=1 Tax=Streptomyces sp. B21-105 TaxID=3039417 RepID=UPI002FF2D47D
MPAQQPQLDGTLPEPSLDYRSWVDTIRPAFIRAARTGQWFTSYEIAKTNDLPEPANPKADWGNFVQSLVRHGVIEHCGWDETSRPGGEHSGVKVWRGTRAAQTGRVA